MGKEDATAMLPVGRFAEIARSAGYDAIIPADAVVYEMRPRGFAKEDEPFESVVGRTLRANSAEAADRLVDLLVERAPRRLNRENVRDFVMRDVMPDTLRETYAAIEDVQYRLESWPLRALLRAITRHLMDRYGVAGDSVRTTKATVSYFFLGKRVAFVRLRKKSLALTVGPSARPCFREDRSSPTDAVFPRESFDRTSGKYREITLILTEEGQLGDALRAIDTVMRQMPGGHGRRG
jgi:hypothetical protein